MIPDPIVTEVRKAGARLAEEAGYDVHRFFENLREAERKYGKPLVQETATNYDATGRPSAPT
jgi:hypothetical protein